MNWLGGVVVVVWSGPVRLNLLLTYTYMYPNRSDDDTPTNKTNNRTHERTAAHPRLLHGRVRLPLVGDPPQPRRRRVSDHLPGACVAHGPLWSLPRPLYERGPTGVTNRTTHTTRTHTH